MNASLKTSLVALIAAAAMLPAAASAQVIVAGGAPGGYNGYPPYYGGFGYPYHASTPAESFMTGQARVIRAAGEYNLNTSAAMINVEEARSRYLDNEVKYVETYFEKRRLNKSYVAAERGPRMTTETAARLSQARQPDRMSAEELDRSNGQIAWPMPLMGDEFAPLRMRIETLFAMQTPTESGINSASYAEINHLVDIASDELKQNVREFAPQQYAMARSFLERLSHEARFPLDAGEALAIR